MEEFRALRVVLESEGQVTGGSVLGAPFETGGDAQSVLPREAFQARTSQDTLGDCVPQLVWECLRILLEELEDLERGKSRLGLLPVRPSPGKADELLTLDET